MPEPIDLGALEAVISAVTKLAVRYRDITGKPLGITGEVGEFHAANLLGWQLAEARQPGYDAVAHDGHRVQIKARCIVEGSRPGQRVGQIKLDHEWDTVALVLMDGDFAPVGNLRSRQGGDRARTDKARLEVAERTGCPGGGQVQDHRINRLVFKGRDRRVRHAHTMTTLRVSACR